MNSLWICTCVQIPITIKKTMIHMISSILLSAVLDFIAPGRIVILPRAIAHPWWFSRSTNQQCTTISYVDSTTFIHDNHTWWRSITSKVSIMLIIAINHPWELSIITNSCQKSWMIIIMMITIWATKRNIIMAEWLPIRTNQHCTIVN